MNENLKNNIQNDILVKYDCEVAPHPFIILLLD